MMASSRGVTRVVAISPSAALLPAMIFFFDAWYIAALTVFAAVVHEAGHYIALRALGGRVKTLRISLTGLALECSERSYVGDIITALAGPAASIALAAASSLVGKMFDFTAAYHAAGLSLVLGIFNLLPAYPLDGGRAIYAAAALMFEFRIAEAIRRVLCAVTTAALFVVGGIMLCKTYNPTLCIAAVWLASQSNMSDFDFI